MMPQDLIAPFNGDRLDSQVRGLRALINDVRLDEWKPRIDELQARLGRLDADDKLIAQVADLRTRWDAAKRREQDASGSVGVDALRIGLERVTQDVRMATVRG